MPPTLEQAWTLPARCYDDPDLYAAEREAVFAREWLLAAHDEQLPEPGDALAQDLAGWPIVLVRGHDGRVRGFHNVCRHRAGPLLPEGAARCDVLRCRYHGWTYDLEGRLVSIPDFGAAEAFDPAEFGLHPIRVDSWRGFLFASLDPQAPELGEAIAPFIQLASDVPFEAARLAGGEAHTIECNWKAYVENYLEGYHIPFLHPGLSREVVVKDYRVDVGDGYVVHRVPSRPTVEAPVYDGFWAWLAPNAAFNVYAEGMSVERMLPLGPHRMRLEYWFFFRDLSPAAAGARDATIAMCRQVTDEDRVICEAVQRNLSAGVYERGRLSPRHENGVFAFQQRIRAALERPDL